MPSVEAHVQQAESNQLLLRELTLARADHRQWAVVYAFYACVHYVQALLVANNLNPQNHNERKEDMAKLLKQDSTYQPAWSDYAILKNRSMDARYMCKGFTEVQLNTDIFPKMRHIEAEIRKRLQLMNYNV